MVLPYLSPCCWPVVSGSHTDLTKNSLSLCILLLFLLPSSPTLSQWAINLGSIHTNEEDNGCGNKDGCNGFNPGLQYEHNLASSETYSLEWWAGGVWNSEKKPSIYTGPAIKTCPSILCLGVASGAATGYDRGITSLGIVGVGAPFAELRYRGVGFRAIWLPLDLVSDGEGAILFQVVF